MYDENMEIDLERADQIVNEPVDAESHSTAVSDTQVDVTVGNFSRSSAEPQPPRKRKTRSDKDKKKGPRPQPVQEDASDSVGAGQTAESTVRLLDTLKLRMLIIESQLCAQLQVKKEKELFIASIVAHKADQALMDYVNGVE
jgi:hypothetical protein